MLLGRITFRLRALLNVTCCILARLNHASSPGPKGHYVHPVVPEPEDGMVEHNAAQSKRVISIEIALRWVTFGHSSTAERRPIVAAILSAARSVLFSVGYRMRIRDLIFPADASVG